MKYYYNKNFPYLTMTTEENKEMTDWILRQILLKAIKVSLEVGENPYLKAKDVLTESYLWIRQEDNEEEMNKQKNQERLVNQMMQTYEMDWLRSRVLGLPLEQMPEEEARIIIEDEPMTLGVYLNALTAKIEE